jgi:peroxidase
MASVASGQLSSTFYDTSCPNALSTIQSAVAAAVSSEPRMGASLLRLHFHDCFVDASLTLPYSVNCCHNYTAKLYN